MSVEEFKFERLELTPESEQHIKKMLAQNPKAKGIRFGVNRTGCNGYGYVLEFELNGKNATDELLRVKDIEFYIDREFLPMLAGTKIGVEQVGVNFQFKFENPNAKNQCGCGESFAY